MSLFEVQDHIKAEYEVTCYPVLWPMGDCDRFKGVYERASCQCIRQMAANKGRRQSTLWCRSSDLSRCNVPIFADDTPLSPFECSCIESHLRFCLQIHPRSWVLISWMKIVTVTLAVNETAATTGTETVTVNLSLRRNVWMSGRTHAFGWWMMAWQGDVNEINNLQLPHTDTAQIERKMNRWMRWWKRLTLFMVG